jgi:hypothetical protein
MSQIISPNEAVENNFFIVSANGYPGILLNHLTNAVKDITEYKNFDFLVIILDSEELSEAERRKEVEESLKQYSEFFTHTKPFIIIQHRCIETWLLGNKTLKVEKPNAEDFKEYLSFYDVFENDPEKMPSHPKYSVHAHFHEAYLKAIFRENNIVYSKRNPGYAKEPVYLENLKNRHQESDHLSSMNSLFQLIDLAKS